MLRKVYKTLLLMTLNLLPLAGSANDFFYGQDCCYADNDCCSSNFAAEVDFLWWEVRSDRQFGYSASTTGIETTRRGLFPKNKWEPGVRLGFYYTDPCKDWTFGVIWTHLDYKSHRGVPTDFVDNFNPGVITPFTFSGFDGSSHHKSDLNYLDLDFLKRIKTCNFTFAPHVGVRGFWHDIHNRLTGAGVIVTNPTTTLTGSFTGHAKHDVSAWGIEGGFWAEFDTGFCGLNVFGHVGGALLLFEDKYSARRGITVDETDVEADRFHAKRHSTNAMWNYQLGLKYATCICDYNLAFTVAWEQVHIERYDVHYHGLTAGVLFAF